MESVDHGPLGLESSYDMLIDAQGSAMNYDRGETWLDAFRWVFGRVIMAGVGTIIGRFSRTFTDHLFQRIGSSKDIGSDVRCCDGCPS